MVSPVISPVSPPQTEIRAKIHPFWRLTFCALGLVGASIVLAVMLFLGDALVTAVTRRPPRVPLAQMVERHVLALTLLSYPLMIGWIALCRNRFDRASFASLGLRRRNVAANLLRGALAGFGTMAFLWSVLWVCGAISVGGLSSAALESGWKSLVPLAGFALAFAAVAFFEELLFRGYILHNFHSWLGWKWAVAIQAILFAIVHLGNVAGGTKEQWTAALGGLPNIALIGIAFALLYRKTGSLWFPIGFHAAWNFSLGCVFSLPVSGVPVFKLLDVQTGNAATSLSGGSFGAEGSWLLWPIAGALLYFISLAPDHPQAILDLKLNRPDKAPVFVDETEETSEEEEERENRFKARFGSETGFDSGTLSSLRQLQQQREEAARRAQPLEHEQFATSAVLLEKVPIGVPEVSSTNAEAEIVSEDVAAPSSTKVEAPIVPTVAPVEIEKVETPVVKAETVTPAPVAPREEAPPKTKKPSPRW